jgi:hypothetical protein
MRQFAKTPRERISGLFARKFARAYGDFGAGSRACSHLFRAIIDLEFSLLLNPCTRNRSQVR